MAEPGFWDNSEEAQKVINKNNLDKETYDSFHRLEEKVEELEILLEMLLEEADSEIEQDLMNELAHLKDEMNLYELSLLLDEPYDPNNAILELHPGAGGTESQDWGSLLLRMYQRWAESQGFKVEMLDYQAGEEAGIKVSLYL